MVTNEMSNSSEGSIQAIPGLLAMRYFVSVNTVLFLIAATFTVFLAVTLKRRQIKRLLEGCGLPTVHWRPRFITYRPFEEDQKMASSTITRILPRMKRLGGPFGMYGTVYGTSAVVHVAHPTPAKAIFGSGCSGNTDKRRRRSSIMESTGASKAPAYNHFKNFCGEGVFTADGEDWKAKRTALMHCLIKGATSSTSDVSQRLEREANRAADTFCDRVYALQKQNPKASVVTNVVPILQRSTAGLIYRYITHDEPEWGMLADPDDCPDMDDISLNSSSLGTEEANISSSERSENKVCSRGANTEATNLLDSYLDAIIRIRMIILAQSRSIWFLLPRWCYRFFSSLYRDEEKTVSPIRAFARKACDSAKPGSPLAKLKEMDSHNGQATVDGISKDLLDEAITLLFAGQDTSAATLSWTLHLLSLHPDVQSKVSDEVRNLLNQEGLDGKNITVERKLLSKLPYLDAVIKESMRLYPVAPFVVRRIMQNLHISDKCQKSNRDLHTILPAGSIACVWIYGLHRNPEFWSKPDDFLPERWIESGSKDLGQTNGAYMPFASGPRNCIGQPLAHVVLRTLLTRLLYRYEFRDQRLGNSGMLDELRKDMQAGFTVLPSGGLTLAIHERI